MDAAAIYRQQFRPSAQLAAPYIMFGLNIVAADTEAEAHFLFSSVQQSFLNIRRGRPGKLPSPVADMENRLESHERAMLDDALACAIVGEADTVRRGLDEFVARTGADELIVTTSIFDHALRLRSFTILAEVHEAMKAAR